MNYAALIVILCGALAVLIPMGIKLYKTTKELIREQNWPHLIAALVRYMEEAETLFEVGADKKAWVLTMIETVAEQIDYELTEKDIENLGDLIDILCDMSRVINTNEAVE